MSQADFVAAFGEVFEHTPAIAEAAWPQRPFPSFEALHQAMVAVVQGLTAAQQLDLIRAHPDLGGKAKMAAASVQEQAGAGLDQLSPEMYQRFEALNQAYKAKFGFPFIVAVKNHTPTSILAAFEQRLNHTLAQERAQALSEICEIAQFRLRSQVCDSP